MSTNLVDKDTGELVTLASRTLFLTSKNSDIGFGV
jgi:hypothetical protein